MRSIWLLLSLIPGASAIALGRMLPTAGPIEPPWDERAAVVETKLGRYIESVNHPDAEARRLHAWARALSGELSDGIARAIDAVGLQDRAGADAGPQAGQADQAHGAARGPRP